MRRDFWTVALVLPLALSLSTGARAQSSPSMPRASALQLQALVIIVDGLRPRSHYAQRMPALHALGNVVWCRTRIIPWCQRSLA